MSLYIRVHTCYSYLYIVFQSKLNISGVMSCGNKPVYTGISVDRFIALLYITGVARWIFLYCNYCIMKSVQREEILCLHSEATAGNSCGIPTTINS